MTPEEQKGLDDLKRLAQAAKVNAAKQFRDGEGSAAEVEKAAKLEVRVATLEQFYRLRDLTRQPGVQPTIEGTLVTRAKTTRRKKTNATRTKAKAD